MLPLIALTVAAVVAIVAVGGRGSHHHWRRAVGVDGAGTTVEPVATDSVAPVVVWAAMAEVVAVARPELWRTRFGFEVTADGIDPFTIDGETLCRAFLTEAHRLEGFDHQAAAVTLGRRRARATCYRRSPGANGRR